MDYVATYELQKKLLYLRQNKIITDTFLFVEHEPVITSGMTANQGNIKVDDQFLNENNVSICRINRGGDVTFHGPGQLVGYPIFDLRDHGRSIREFIFNLEEVFIRYLGEVYNVKASRNKEHKGVWIENDKIVAVGLEIKKWVSMHGFAFNINTDLRYFEWIIPCGIRDKGVTSLEKVTHRNIPLDEIREGLYPYISQVFGVTIDGLAKSEFLEETELLYKKEFIGVDN